MGGIPLDCKLKQALSSLPCDGQFLQPKKLCGRQVQLGSITELTTGSLNYLSLGGSNLMHIYSNFDGFPLNGALFGVIFHDP